MSKYLLDSNVLIQAHQMHYPFDIVPNFWKKLLDLFNKGIIISLDKVKKELCGNLHPDELELWCTNVMPSSFFNDSSNCIDTYSEIALWANGNQHFTQGAIDEFLATDLADPWLIAYAKKNNCVIVTHELSQPQRKNRIKIPEPCIHFGIRYITSIEMFRELNETF